METVFQSNQRQRIKAEMLLAPHLYLTRQSEYLFIDLVSPSACYKFIQETWLGT
jgi:hypothetical protein